MVTILDEATMSDEYRDRIKENRNYYAARHGPYSIRKCILALALTSFNRLYYILPRRLRL